MKILTVREMQKIDRIAIEEYGIPAIILMENAGRCAANEAARFVLRKLSSCAPGSDENGSHFKISVFCGGGNNGGDGFVAARHLSNQGFEIKLILSKTLSDFEKLPASNESVINLRILQKMGIEIISYPELKDRQELEKITGRSSLFIDALLGTGFKPPVSGKIRELIEYLNCSGVPVMSVDIPSGLDGDTGLPKDIAVKAALTVTLGFAKRGHFENEGRKYTGDLIVCDIGIPSGLIKQL